MIGVVGWMDAPDDREISYENTGAITFVASDGFFAPSPTSIRGGISL